MSATAPPGLGFRPMTEADLPLVADWLRAPHTQPWWNHERDYDEIAQAVAGEGPVAPWILLVDGRAAGYFQCYDVGHDDEYRVACASVGVEPGTAGIDYLVGESALVGGGIGTRAIGVFLREIVFGGDTWTAVCAGPDPANAASRRVLEKNGFRVAGDIETDDGPERLMVLARADWERSGEPVEGAAQDGE